MKYKLFSTDEEWTIESNNLEILENLARVFNGLSTTYYQVQEIGLRREDVMKSRTDFHRNNAAELFGNRLFSREEISPTGHHITWYETATGKPVTFTPYGWITE